MKPILFFLSFLIFFNCKEENQEILTAQDIIDNSIVASGGEKFDNSIIDFDFRDKHYHAKRNNGEFELVRTFKDSIKKTTDFLTNKGFERHINNKKIEVPDSMVSRFSASVNSVHYFSVLPYGLNDKAVIKELLKETTINNTEYYKVKVTFKQDGGGEDFEDIFVYWIDKQNFKVDYLAYSYKEYDGAGLRFREAINERFVNGLRFVDYNNYKPSKTDVTVYELDNMFVNNKLALLSKIELKNINVD